MFSIPHQFSKEDEGYITLPALKRFVKDKNQEDLKTTVDRAQLIKDIEKFAQTSSDNEELVLEWLDQVLVEGIKDVQVNYFNLESRKETLLNTKLLEMKLESLIQSDGKRHLIGKYTKDLKLFRYQIIESAAQGKSVKLYLGKLLCCWDKKNNISSKIPYPIFVEVYIDKGIIVSRAKSKSGLLNYMEQNIDEDMESTTVDKQLNETVNLICTWFDISKESSISTYPKFKRLLYLMVEKYTQTPNEIKALMEESKPNIENIINIIMNDICKLSPRYKSDVNASVLNMIEKYFSISYKNKSIFTNDRDAYPLKLNATDEEESKVEQTAALEEPLQSKGIFFDNKKMLQNSQACDGVIFRVKRINPLYCSKWFKVKITVKKECCLLKFTEYTMEEDIINVLFSFVSITEPLE